MYIKFSVLNEYVEKATQKRSRRIQITYTIYKMKVIMILSF